MSAFLHSFDGRWLLRNFAYHDVLMSVTMDRAPLITGYCWQDDLSSLRLPDSYFGFASVLIYNISEISVLNAAWHAGTIESAQFNQCTRALECDLLTWACPNTSDLALEALAEMYRSAALLHLYRIICRHTPGVEPEFHDRIQHQVDTIISRMQSMPSGSGPECTALFPIFMCGTETNSLEHTHAVRERLRAIETSRNFKNFENAISVLEELWRRRGLNTAEEPKNDPADWRDILKSWGWNLSLS